MNKNDKKFLIEIENNLGGKPLSPDFMKNFELEFNKFKDNFNPDTDESKKHLDDMVKLLSISEENLEKVKNQKWFQRVWFTIAGKNKKLERINKINLLKVQKGSLYFLQKLANQSTLFMKSVNFALKRIDDIQIQNEKIKGYLFKIVDKYNERITNIEIVIDKHKKDIAEIKSKNIPNLGLFLASLFLIGSSITLLFVFERNWVIWIGSVLLFLLGILFLLGAFSKDDDKNTGIIDTSDNYTIKLENERVKPELKKNLSEMIFNILENDYLYFPILPLIENYTKISDLLEPLSKESGMKTEELAEIINKTLQISPEFKQEIIVNCSKTADEYVNIINEVITDIVKSYLPKSIGIELKTHIDYSKRNATNKQILSIIEPYFENLGELELIRTELINDFPDYKKILTKKGWVEFIKGGAVGFASAALLGPIGWIGAMIWALFSDGNAEEIVENFANKFEGYMGKWESLLGIIKNSIHPFLQNVTKSFVSEAVHNMDIMFDEFSKQNNSLVNLNDEIMEMLEEQRKNLEE